MDVNSLPMILNVKEVAEVMRIGVNKAYELVRDPNFPSIRHGSRILIPRDAFIRWMNSAV